MPRTPARARPGEARITISGPSTFYERLTQKPSIDPRMQALAFHRLAFTRMVSTANRPACWRSTSAARSPSMRSCSPPSPAIANSGIGLADSLLQRRHVLHVLPRRDRARRSRRSGSAIADRRKSERVESPMEPDLLERWPDIGSNSSSLAGAGARRAEAGTRASMPCWHLSQRITRPRPVQGQGSSPHWAATSTEKLATEMAQSGWAQEQEAALRRGLTFVPDHPGPAPRSRQSPGVPDGRRPRHPGRGRRGGKEVGRASGRSSRRTGGCSPWPISTPMTCQVGHRGRREALKLRATRARPPTGYSWP